MSSDMTINNQIGVMAACNQVLPDMDIVCPVLKPIPNSVWE